MYYNREKELHKQRKYREGWNISKKYTDILMQHSENDRNIDMCFAIHSQYMNELKTRNIPRNKKPPKCRYPALYPNFDRGLPSLLP